MPTNYNRANLITESATLFPDNNTQEISPADLRQWLEDGTTSFVTQKDKSTLENAIFENKASTLASGATVDLNTATGNYLHISGTSTINSFGTCPAGARFIIVFDAAATLTYNATSLIIPGLANKTAAAGDCCMIVSEGSGNWRIVGYFAISGGGGGGSVTSITAGTGLNGGTITSSGTIDLANTAVIPASYTNADITVDAQGRITAASSGSPGGVTSVTATTPLLSSGGSAPDISITQADAITDGYLSSLDWNKFSNKQDAITLTTSGTSGASTLIGSTLNIPNYSGGGTPGGSNGDFQYKNGGSFDGSSLLRLASGFIVAHTPKIGDSNTTGHFHMYNASSAPTGINNYLTMFWQSAAKALGFRSETDTFTSKIALTTPTADRTYTLPDASGNVVLDTAIQSLSNKTLTTPTISGIATFGNGASAGEIRLLEPSGDGSNYVALKSQATTADYSITLPPAAPSGAQYLQSTGTGGVLQWTSGTTTGVSSVGTINSATKNPNGVVISGSNIIMQTADATNVGLVSIGTQTFAGAKTFSDAATFSAAGSTTVAQLTFSGTTNNWISFGTTGASIPTFTNRSVGTKIVVYPSVSASALDYAIGFGGATTSNLWLTSPASIQFYAHSGGGSGTPITSGQFEYASTSRGLNLNAASDATNSIPQLNLSGTGGGTWISFTNTSNAAAPTLLSTSRSIGTKITLYPVAIGSANLDYGLGVSDIAAGLGLWLSSPTQISFFTNNSTSYRAQLSSTAFNIVSGTVYQVAGTKVVGARETGYVAFTGTTNKGTSYATGTVTLIQLAERVAAIQASLTTHGLIG